jgi:hypothetical protein
MITELYGKYIVMGVTNFNPLIAKRGLMLVF